MFHIIQPCTATILNHIPILSTLKAMSGSLGALQGKLRTAFMEPKIAPQKTT